MTLLGWGGNLIKESASVVGPGGLTKWVADRAIQYRDHVSRRDRPSSGAFSVVAFNPTTIPTNTAAFCTTAQPREFHRAMASEGTACIDCHQGIMQLVPSIAERLK